MSYSGTETIEHLKKLAIAYADQMTFLDSYGYGEWGVDQKRPFGNSMGVQADILEACDIEPEGDEDGLEYYSEQQKTYADYLYCDCLGIFLIAIIKSHCSNQSLSQELAEIKIPDLKNNG